MIEVIAVVLAGLLVAAYFERKTLAADAKAAEAKVISVAQHFIGELTAKETVIRAKIKADVVKVIANAKANLEADLKKIEAVEKEAAAKIDAEAKTVIANIEADLKKII